MALFKNFKNLSEYPLVEDIYDWWSTYGGLKALLCSPFLLFSIIVTGLCYNQLGHGSTWNEDVKGVLPNLLGFSLGAMAILLTLPSTKTFSAYRENGIKKSYYMNIASSFTHFIIIQVITLIIAVIYPSYSCVLFNIIGFFFFIYSLVSGVSICLLLYSIARDFNSHQ